MKWKNKCFQLERNGRYWDTWTNSQKTNNNLLCLFLFPQTSWLDLWQPASSEHERLNPGAGNAVQNGSLWGSSRKVCVRWAKDKKKQNTRAYFNTWRERERGFIWAGICCVCLENQRNWAVSTEGPPTQTHTQQKLIQNIVSERKSSLHTLS